MKKPISVLPMSATDSFFDTNTLLYLISDEPGKAARSKDLLGGGGTISVQVLNEFAAVSRRKHKLPWPKVRELLADFQSAFDVVPVTMVSHSRAMLLAERHHFSVYDANVVAAALIAGCRVLYSEDMQDGQLIEGLTIRNPYKT